jgi:hypothetical protein
MTIFPERGNQARSSRERPVSTLSGRSAHRRFVPGGKITPTYGAEAEWLRPEGFGQYTPHIIAGRSPPHRPEPGLKSGAAGHGAKRYWCEVVEGIRVGLAGMARGDSRCPCEASISE